MADEITELILLVTGSTLRAEQMDRPLAYYLQTQVEELASEHGSLPSLVISDARWLHEKELQQMPTISVGGPGVNMLSQKWLDDLESVLVNDEKFIVQMDLANSPRACVWGMNNPLTKLAVVTFAGKFLPQFMQACSSPSPRRKVGGEP